MFEIILNCPFDFSWPAHHLEVCYLVFRHRRIFYSNSFFQQWCPIDADLHYQAQKVYVSAKHLPPSCKLFFVFFTSKINSDVSHPRPVSLLTWENNMCQCGEYQEKYGDARKGSHLSSSNVLLWWDLWRCSRRFIPNLAQLAFTTCPNCARTIFSVLIWFRFFGAMTETFPHFHNVDGFGLHRWLRSGYLLLLGFFYLGCFQCSLIPVVICIGNSFIFPLWLNIHNTFTV